MAIDPVQFEKAGAIIVIGLLFALWLYLDHPTEPIVWEEGLDDEIINEEEDYDKGRN